MSIAPRSSHPPRLTPLAACLALALAGGANPIATAQPATAPTVAGAATQSPAYQLRQQLRRQAIDEAGAHPHRGNRPQSGLGPAPTGGNVLPVTSCLDDGSPGTLRSVVASAAENDTVDLSQLACSTITLASGPIDSSVLGDHHLYNLTIQGPGEDLLTIDGAGAGQVFVAGGFSSDKGRFELVDLTVANGVYTHGLAGCIEGFGGVVALTRVTVTDCAASNGSPLTFGGAVDVTTLEMTSSTIKNSSSAATGGAVAIGGGAYATQDAVLVDSTISGNSVTAETGQDGTYLTAGGGLYVRGDLTLVDSTISGNSIVAGGIARGGGVFTRGYADITGTTFSDNAADGDGGGLYKAIFSNYGDPFTTLTIANSTFSGNTSGANGGGLVSTRQTTLTNSTIAFNTAASGGGGLWFADGGTGASTLDLQSTILAGNSAPLGADFGASAVPSVSGANNLVVSADPAITLPTDTLAEDPLLLPLAINGGATATHALGTGSPAIDTGNNVAALEFDQRGEGFARVSGDAADIGAFELQQPPPDEDTIFRDGFDGAAPPTVEYAWDDGDGDTNQGPPSSFDPDMLWGNYYVAQPGGEVITEISIAFGPTFPSLADGPVTFWLLADDDGDSDPRNARAIASIPATPDVFNDTFYTVTISPTYVGGGFFVAASAKLLGGEDRPARVDTDAPGDKSWFCYAPDIAATIDDLAAAPFCSRMDDPNFVIFPGAFMVRATGVATLP
jgi:hypothetical protein